MKMSSKNRQKKISVLFVSMVNVSQRMEEKFQKSGNMRHPRLYPFMNCCKAFSHFGNSVRSLTRGYHEALAMVLLQKG